MKDKEQNVKYTSIITSTVLKTDTADSNRCTYNKEALENAVKEYNAKHNDNKLEIKHDGTVEFIMATNEAFENGVNNEMLNEIYKHDWEDYSNLINPYLIDTEALIKTVMKERNSEK